MLSKIGKGFCERLDIIPAKIQAIRILRPKYACESCEGVESEKPAVVIAAALPRITPKESQLRAWSSTLPYQDMPMAFRSIVSAGTYLFSLRGSSLPDLPWPAR